MKPIIPFAICAFLVFGTSQLFAHGGHDHETPGSVKSYNGGIVKAGKNADIEILQLANKVLIYILNDKTKPISPTEVKLQIQLKNDRTKKTETIIAKHEKDGFSFEKDLAGDLHSLRLTVTYKSETANVELKLEPQ